MGGKTDVVKGRVKEAAGVLTGNDKLRAQGNHVEFYEIDGTSGHLDGIFSIAKVADPIKAFLTK